MITALKLNIRLKCCLNDNSKKKNAENTRVHFKHNYQRKASKTRKTKVVPSSAKMMKNVVRYGGVVAGVLLAF